LETLKWEKKSLALKCADDLVILAKGEMVLQGMMGKLTEIGRCYGMEMVLQGMVGKLTEIGRCYGMEMNVDKIKIMRISRQTFPVKHMIDQKQLWNVLNSRQNVDMLTNGGKCTVKLNPGLLWQKLHLTRRLLFL
jgi:hypothetical protein